MKHYMHLFFIGQIYWQFHAVSSVQYDRKRENDCNKWKFTLNSHINNFAFWNITRWTIFFVLHVFLAHTLSRYIVFACTILKHSAFYEPLNGIFIVILHFIYRFSFLTHVPSSRVIFGVRKTTQHIAMMMCM